MLLAMAFRGGMAELGQAMMPSLKGSIKHEFSDFFIH